MTMKKLIIAVLLFVSTGIWAQTDIAKGDYYTIEPDNRYCPSPYCGGWWLTKVNQYSITADESVLDSSVVPIVPNPIYVAKIDYSVLGLTDREIAEFQNNIYQGRAFIRGVLRPYPSPWWYKDLQQLTATGTWLAANDNRPIGPYMNVKSSGIVCITTPCPYYELAVLNTNYSSLFHELNLAHAGLTDRQTEMAWAEVADDGLIITGVRFESQGQTGTGLGIAATKVFFTFPFDLKTE